MRVLHSLSRPEGCLFHPLCMHLTNMLNITAPTQNCFTYTAPTWRWTEVMEAIFEELRHKDAAQPLANFDFFVETVTVSG